LLTLTLSLVMTVPFFSTRIEQGFELGRILPRCGDWSTVLAARVAELVMARPPRSRGLSFADCPLGPAEDGDRPQRTVPAD